MPNTIVQNQLGIGGSGGAGPVQQGGLTSPLGGTGSSGSGPVNPYDLARSFNNYYGGMPAHQIVSGMAAGQTPQPAVSPVGPVSHGPQVDTSTNVAGPAPSDVGRLESAMPGAVSGHGVNGIPASEGGVAAPTPKPPGMPVHHTGAPPRPMPPRQTPQPGSSTPGMSTDMGVPENQPATPELPTQQGMAAALAEPDPTREAAMPGPDATAGETAQPGSGSDGSTDKTKGGVADLKSTPAAVPTKVGADSTAQNATTQTTSQPVNVNGISYNLNPGSKLPPAWNQLNTAQKLDFLTKHAAPVSAIQQTAMRTLNKYADLTGLTLPTTNPVSGSGFWFDDKTPQLAVSSGVGNDASLSRLVYEAQNLHRQMNDPIGQGQPPQVAQQRAARLADIESVLKSYGVQFGKAPTQDTGNTGNTGNQGNNGAGNGNTGNDNNGNVGNTGNTGNTGNQDTNTGGVGGTGQTDTTNPQQQPLDWNEMSQIAGSGGDSYQSLVNYFNSKGWGDKSPAMAEQAMAWQQQGFLNTNRQTAATGFADAAGKLSSSPLYIGSQNLAADILKNPNTVNEQLLENKSVSDSDAALKSGLGDLSASFNRRGIGPAAGSGIAGDIYRQHAGDIASRLGDLKIQQGARERQDQQNAIATALATMGATTGQDISNAATLGNIVTGQPADYQNAASGAAAAFMNIDATQAKIDAAKQAGQFGIQDVMSILFGGQNSPGNQGVAALLASMGA